MTAQGQQSGVGIYLDAKGCDNPIFNTLGAKIIIGKILSGI